MILRGSRIVMPKALRPKLLQLAHEGHPGESAMKRRIRAKVWWPRVDREVEAYVKTCWDCLLVSQPNNPEPMKRHAFPDGPWQCVAADLLGPLPNSDYVFVLIDYYSRYQEVKFLRRITSETIITVLNEIFCRLGIPKSIRADNGRQFVSGEFRKFCDDHNITLITTPPYWPQANGEVENMNRSLVKRLKIAHNNRRDYVKEIQNFLLMYNVTPHGTTGTPPTELMFNRVIRDKIPGIQDITEGKLDSAARDLDVINKAKGKEAADKKRRAKICDIAPGDKVVLRNVVFPHKLTPTFDTLEYEIIEKKGMRSSLLAEEKPSAVT
ncbi:uncharacterized protein K02A2.6-like [Anastrepha ludens]|uniref:uncharacterized protein K02A2.6-like n=1 Tax=Anastrepha ludens TaxID=28586 RepID=UPI0023AFB7E4|nr:uncharacterized protein K02A2.6-like [Anastrepha ludens]XP_053968584.1 uncharacterized protein K02A2.6-like [Anastrepha ludens]